MRPVHGTSRGSCEADPYTWRDDVKDQPVKTVAGRLALKMASTRKGLVHRGRGHLQGVEGGQIWAGG